MKISNKTEPLYQKITGFRWLALVGAITLVILYLAVIWWVQPFLSSLLPYWLTLLIYGVLGGAALWITLDWLFKKLAQKSETEAELTARKIHSLLDATKDRASALAGFASGLEPADAASLAALLSDNE